MGQTITRLLWHLAGPGESLFSDHHHGRNDEATTCHFHECSSSTWSILERCQKFGRSIISLIRRLLGRDARKPPSGAGKQPSGTRNLPLYQSSLHPYLKEENASWLSSDRHGTAAGCPHQNYCAHIKIDPSARKPPPIDRKPPLDRPSLYPYLKEENTSRWSSDQQTTAGAGKSHHNYCTSKIDPSAGKPVPLSEKPPLDGFSFYPSRNHCVDIEIDPVSDQHVDLPQRAIIGDVDNDDENDVVVAVPPAKQPRWGSLGPYSGSQRILLVGEGDFSFSATLAVAFGDASNMVATSLDSFEFLIANYKRALANILELTSRMCMVMHGVDATKMAVHPQLDSPKFDCIVYNFPHAGFANRYGPRDTQIREHQELVKGFLANAKKMIKVDGLIHITHKCVGFFLDWDLEALGSSEGLWLVEEAPFHFRDYPGYRTKYGYGGDANFNSNPSKTYKFRLALPEKKRQRKQKKGNKGVGSREGICV